MGSNGELPPTAIPTVDISPFLDEQSSQDAKDQVVEAMRDACTTFGFFYLVGHGIPEEDRQKVLDCTKLYFSLPTEEKMETWIGKAMGRSFRGYEPPALQVHQEGLLPDTKEVSCGLHGNSTSDTNRRRVLSSAGRLQQTPLRPARFTQGPTSGRSPSLTKIFASLSWTTTAR
jgi:isopenicillin N synthase-like dioxygenase